MPGYAIILAAIINLLKEGLVAYTIEELTKAVSNALGRRVTTKEVEAILNRNPHRITYVGDHFELTIEF